MPTNWQIGQKAEKEVEQMYKNSGYITWRPIKSRFGKQDVLGIADIVAMNRDELVLLAVTCRKSGAKTETKTKILDVAKHLPHNGVKIRYYVKHPKDEGVWKVTQYERSVDRIIPKQYNFSLGLDI